MEPWPRSLVIFWRLVLVPAVATLVLLGLSAVVRPPVALFVFVVIIFNLVAAQFDADSRRMADLEEKLDALLQEVRDIESKSPTIES